MSEQPASPATSEQIEHGDAHATLRRFIAAAERMFGVRQVFGDPIETGSGTIVPVATVIGGQGVGFGDGEVEGLERLLSEDEDDVAVGPSRGSGGGGGTGVVGWPAGAYVTENGQTRWHPAIDPNVLILAGTALAGCIVTAVASVAVLKSFSRTAGTIAASTADAATSIAATGASTFVAATDKAADTSVTLASMARDAFGAAAGSASATALGLGGMGAKVVTDSTSVVANAAAAGLGSLAEALRRGE